jgi:hypothetical protein
MKKTAVLKLICFTTAVCCFDLFISYLVIGRDMSHLYKENGLLENLQVIFLLLTMSVLLVQFYFRVNSHRFFSLAGAFLCLVFILRELDVEKLDVPRIVIVLGSGCGRDVLMSVMGLALLAYAVRNSTVLRGLLPGYLCTLSLFTVFVGLLFLVFGGLFDKGWIVNMHNQFFEEILEMTGYYFMFAGVVVGLDSPSRNNR